MSSIELWPKQQEVFDFAKDRDKVALLCEQRTGKTFITLKLLEHRMEQGELVGLLVGILNNKESTWLHHLQKVEGLQVFTDFVAFRKAKGHRLFVTHFEQLVSLIGKLVKYRKFNWAAVDEAHRLYDAGSAQSRAMARLHWIERKVIMTGTPMEKRPTDFFGQFKFLDPSVFGTNKGEFEEEWMDWRKLDFNDPLGPKPGGPAFKEKMKLQRILKSKAQFKWDRIDEFVELIADYCIRIEKTDVGIIPPTIELKPFKLDRRMEELYRQMEEESWVDLPDGAEVLATMPATYRMKLRQLACGFIYDGDGEPVWLSDSKVNRVFELFESMPKPVVIFCAFVPELERLVSVLEAGGYDVASVYGGTPKKKRPALWKAFQGAQLDAIVCQLRAGGVGVDLWKGSYGIVSSMEYSSIVWDQAKARMDSREKSVPAHITVLAAKSTIDEELFDLLEKKGLETKTVLQRLKRRYPWPKNRRPPHPRSRKPSTTSTPSPTTSASRRPKSGSCSAARASRSPARPGAGTRRPTTTRS